MNIIQQLEAEQAQKLGALRATPEFQPGDTVIVNVKVKEGERTRVQAYEGVVIARNGGGINESFTVRKISYGEGVERVFPIFSPNIDSIKVIRRGKVRRAKLYYLRDRRGKSARIAERQETPAAKAAREAAKKETKAKAKAAKAKPAARIGGVPTIARGRPCGGLFFGHQPPSKTKCTHCVHGSTMGMIASSVPRLTNRRVRPASASNRLLIKPRVAYLR